jgi:hypothetical protein
MLAFERAVVDALIDSDDPDTRTAVTSWVDSSLRELPEVVRLGVLAESVGFGMLARVIRGGPAALVPLLERSPIGLVRQYPRLFRSLVLFGELELRVDRAVA